MVEYHKRLKRKKEGQQPGRANSGPHVDADKLLTVTIHCLRVPWDAAHLPADFSIAGDDGSILHVKHFPGGRQVLSSTNRQALLSLLAGLDPNSVLKFGDIV